MRGPAAAARPEVVEVGTADLETALRAASGLVATTVELDDPDRVDLLGAAGADGVYLHGAAGADGGDGPAGVSFGGRGVALRIRLDGGLARRDRVGGVAAVLAAVDRDDPVGTPGSGPVALGALAFAADATGTLEIPAVLVARSAGRAWVTTIGPAGTSGQERRDAVVAAARRGPGDYGDPPDGFTLASPIDHATWRDLVAAAVKEIDAGALAKVVLARRVDITANRPFVTSDVVARLALLYPTCTVFRIDGFLGASPELLVERHATTVRSHPLAGTIARSGDVAADRALVAGLMASGKDRREHGFVIDGLRAALEPVCTTLAIPDTPAILELRNVSHLATDITGVLAADAAHPVLGHPGALDLVARVHPTPAVGGTPTAEATAYLAAVEGFARGRYAGPVGWVDARGDGAWAIGIRSADVAGRHASMYAGVGIVAGSDPRAELAETQLKLQALLAALVRP